MLGMLDILSRMRKKAYEVSSKCLVAELYGDDPFGWNDRYADGYCKAVRDLEIFINEELDKMASDYGQT